MMQRRPKRSTSGARWLWIVLLSAALQIPIFLGFSHYLSTGQAVDYQRQARIRLTGYRPLPPKPEPTPEPLPEDAQVVEVPATEEEEPDQTLDTKYIADRTTRTDKETKARPSRKTSKRSGRVKPDREVSEVQSERSRSPEPTRAESEPVREAMARQRDERPEAATGQQTPKTVIKEGFDDDVLMPVTTERARIANLQGASGNFASDDHLPDVSDTSDSTVLNANRYKHADFFYRVREAVRRHWHPDQVYRIRDPNGRAYGVKDRYTVLHVTLDPAGRLKQLITHRRSGLDFMDAEAKGAFRRAQPFPNPPEDMVDAKGEIRFQFGFYFEITSGRHQFEWKRL